MVCWHTHKLRWRGSSQSRAACQGQAEPIACCPAYRPEPLGAARKVGPELGFGRAVVALRDPTSPVSASGPLHLFSPPVEGLICSDSTQPINGGPLSTQTTRPPQTALRNSTPAVQTGRIPSFFTRPAPPPPASHQAMGPPRTWPPARSLEIPQPPPHPLPFRSLLPFFPPQHPSVVLLFPSPQGLPSSSCLPSLLGTGLLAFHFSPSCRPGKPRSDMGVSYFKTHYGIWLLQNEGCKQRVPAPWAIRQSSLPVPLIGMVSCPNQSPLSLPGVLPGISCLQAFVCAEVMFS